MDKFKHSLLGGTFDHFHTGHQSFIDAAFERSEKVTLCLSLPELYRKKALPFLIQDYETRRDAVKAHLELRGYLRRAEIFPLTDIYGPALKDEGYDALFVTKDTFPNSELINKAREESGLKSLEIVAVPFLKGPDEKIISSERIRSGEIDRQGKPYLAVFDREVLVLPRELRGELRKPLGQIVGKRDLEGLNQRATMVITVGDIVSIFLSKEGYQPDLAVFDFKTRREKVDHEDLAKAFDLKGERYENEAGTINSRTSGFFRLRIEKFLENKEKQTLLIAGEEDLLTLSAILLAPLGSVIYYGQVDLGAVAVEVTEGKKKEILDFINRLK